jgi:alpha-tubulin suppressor-like RCC1 family protein
MNEIESRSARQGCRRGWPRAGLFFCLLLFLVQGCLFDPEHGAAIQLSVTAVDAAGKTPLKFQGYSFTPADEHGDRAAVVQRRGRDRRHRDRERRRGAGHDATDLRLDDQRQRAPRPEPRDAGSPNSSRMQIAAGTSHSCAIADGALYCWGSNEQGQLGMLALPFARTPRIVGDARDWDAVSLGFDHSCGLRAGDAFCWGGNAEGQLGQGDQTPRAQPTRVGSRSDWAAIAAGTNFSCGIAGGELWCWGSNAVRQLATGDSSSRSSPTRIGAAADWSALALAPSHLCGPTRASAVLLGLRVRRPAGSSRVGADGSDRRRAAAGGR